MVNSYHCVFCKKRAKLAERRPLTEKLKKHLRNLLPNLSHTDVVCGACRVRYYRLSKRQLKQKSIKIPANDDPMYEPRPTPSKQLLSPLSITLKIPSTSRSHSRCFVCKRPGPKLVSLSDESRLSTFLKHNVVIPADSRCCPRHIHDGLLVDAAVLDIQTMTDTTQTNRTSINDLLQKMRVLCLQRNKYLNFDILNDCDYQSLTSLSRTQFDDVCRHLSDKVKNTPNRSCRTTIGIFLLKLYSGMSNRILSTIFGISKSSVRRAVSTVRLAFMRGFVPLYLGLDSLTREIIISKHTRDIAKTLFGTGDKQIILVLDGTYIYINKSNNFKFQRRSYSMHKGRPLVKPMVVVTTTGYFVTIVGPYLSDSKNNDASILNHMLQSNIEDMRGFLQDGDVFVVDRGFRDSLMLLEQLGIQAQMPSIISKGQKQMSTEESNSSRLVTKIRWVLESANSRIKRFKYLDHVLPNSQIPYIGDFVRIVCALSNKYFPPLSSTADPEKEQEVARGMLERSNKGNSLKHLVEEKGLARRIKIWRRIDGIEMDKFPRMTEDQLRHLTFGVYQLRMSSSYLQEHVQGNCEIKIHVDEPGLLCVRMRSRHTSSKRYMMWLRYSEAVIEAWYCQCKAGSRVVGMCSHLAAIVWYLSAARYENKEKFGVRDWSVHLADASSILVDDSSSDSE